MFLCRLGLLTAFVLTPCICVGDLFLYSVGNSLTVDLYSNGRINQLSYAAGESALTSDRHIRCGQGLTPILANPNEICVNTLQFGTFQQAFASTKFDAVTLQPSFGFATIRDEVASATELVRQLRLNPENANTRVLIYGTWGQQTSTTAFQSTWHSQGNTLDSLFVPSEQTYQIFMDEFRQSVPNAELIPVGHVYSALIDRIESPEGIPGLTSANDLWRDDLHASNAGQYLSAITAYSVLYGKTSEGLDPTSQYNLASYGMSFDPLAIPIVQELSWGVTQNFTAVPEVNSFTSLVVVLSGILVFAGLRRWLALSHVNSSVATHGG